MSTVQIKKCPKCGAVYERNTYAHRPSKYNRIKYGSPLKKCRNCNAVFKDDEYRELALESARDVDRSVVSPYGIFVGIMAAGMVIIGLCANSPALGLALGALFGWVPFTEAVSYKKRQLDLDMETIQSKKRLYNPFYAIALKQVGYSVPDIYLPDAEMDTKLENISKLEEEEKSLREKIKAESKRKSTIYIITFAVIAVAVGGSFLMKKSSSIGLEKWQEVMNSEELFERSETAGDKFVVYEREREAHATEYSYQRHYLPRKRVASEPSEVGYIFVVEYEYHTVGEYKTPGFSIGTPAYRVYTVIKLYDRHTGSYVNDREILEGDDPPSSISMGSKNNGRISSDAEIKGAIEALTRRNIDHVSEEGSDGADA